MNDELHHKHRKYWLLCLFAVFIAVLGTVLPEQENIAFEIVKNNTDLCQFNHTSMLCDGSRKNNLTYYTNDTPIILTVYAHANTAGQTAGVFVYRDDILVEAQSGRPLAAPEETWRGITLIIPKNTRYRVNITNFHHFNWTEDIILSGKNGTLSYNQTNITNIISGGNWTIDTDFTNRYPAQRQLGVTYWNNQSKPMILDFTFANLTANIVLNYTLWVNGTIVDRSVSISGRSGGFYYFIPNGANYNITNTSSGLTPVILWHEHNLTFTPSTVNNFYNTTGGGVSFNGTPVNLNGTNLYNGTISNYSTLSYTNDSLNLKVNKSGDNMTGNLMMLGNLSIGISRGSVGFSQNYSSPFGQYGSLVNYDTSYGSYIGLTENAYFNTTEAFWYRANRTKGSIIMQMMGNNFTSTILGQENYGLQVYAVKENVSAVYDPTNQGYPIQYSEFEVVMLINQKSFTLDGNMKPTFSNLTGAGNVYACLDASGTLYRGSPGC